MQGSHEGQPQTTADDEDWGFGIDPATGFSLVSATRVNGQLVVTLEATKDANLTGKVFDVKVTALADQDQDSPEELFFDINDYEPAIYVNANVVIGGDRDDKDDYLISIL